MAAKTKNFRQLRERGLRDDPDWDAKVAEHKRAMEDAVALAKGGSTPTATSPSRRSDRKPRH
jgi:hypothetical protein